MHIPCQDMMDVWYVCEGLCGRTKRWVGVTRLCFVIEKVQEVFCGGGKWVLWLRYKLCLLRRREAQSPRWSRHRPPPKQSRSTSQPAALCLISQTCMSEDFLHVQGKAWLTACIGNLPFFGYLRSIIRCILVPDKTQTITSSSLLILEKLDRHDMRESANTLS